MTGARSRLFALRTSPLWCRLAVVAPFVVLGAIALGACGSDADDASVSDTLVSDTSVADTSAPETATQADDGATADETTDDAEQGSGADAELFPDVVDATATIDADGTWTFAATLSSPYDTPERYADAWRVVGPDGSIFGIRELAHDHAGEQPFTRSQSGIEIPESVTTVTVEGRDQVSGWGGATVAVELVR